LKVSRLASFPKLRAVRCHDLVRTLADFLVFRVALYDTNAFADDVALAFVLRDPGRPAGEDLVADPDHIRPAHRLHLVLCDFAVATREQQR